MKKILRPIGIAAVLMGGVFLFSGTAQAFPDGPVATCNATGNHFFGQLFDDVRVFSSHNPTTVTQALAAPIPAGTYALTTVAWDGTSTDKRVAQVEPWEIYFLQLLDDANNVLATSGVTTDLEDGVIEAEWAGSIGQVTWAGADATQVRIVHGNIGFPDFQRVYAVCFGWSPAQVVTTTTTAFTTTTSTTTTSTTTVPTTSTPVDPTTTTTVPTVVLPEVEESQPADPVQGDPTFTG